MNKLDKALFSFIFVSGSILAAGCYIHDQTYVSYNRFSCRSVEAQDLAQKMGIASDDCQSILHAVLKDGREKIIVYGRRNSNDRIFKREVLTEATLIKYALGTSFQKTFSLNDTTKGSLSVFKKSEEVDSIFSEKENFCQVTMTSMDRDQKKTNTTEYCSLKKATALTKYVFSKINKMEKLSALELIY